MDAAYVGKRLQRKAKRARSSFPPPHRPPSCRDDAKSIGNFRPISRLRRAHTTLSLLRPRPSPLQARHRPSVVAISISSRRASQPLRQVRKPILPFWALA